MSDQTKYIDSMELVDNRGTITVSSVIQNRSTYTPGGTYSIDGGQTYQPYSAMEKVLSSCTVTFGGVEDRLTPDAVDVDVHPRERISVSAKYLQQGWAVFDYNGVLVSSGASGIPSVPDWGYGVERYAGSADYAYYLGSACSSLAIYSGASVGNTLLPTASLVVDGGKVDSAYPWGEYSSSSTASGTRTNSAAYDGIEHWQAGGSYTVEYKVTGASTTNETYTAETLNANSVASVTCVGGGSIGILCIAGSAAISGGEIGAISGRKTYYASKTEYFSNPWDKQMYLYELCGTCDLTIRGGSIGRVEGVESCSVLNGAEVGYVELEGGVLASRHFTEDTAQVTSSPDRTGLYNYYSDRDGGVLVVSGGRVGGCGLSGGFYYSSQSVGSLEFSHRIRDVVSVCDGGVLENAEATCADMTVSSGGTAEHPVLQGSYASLTVLSGGTAIGVVNFGGTVISASGAVVVPDYPISGSGLVVSDYREVRGGTSMADTTIISGGRLHVLAGTYMSNTVVSSGGSLLVESGASSLAIKEDGGYVAVAGGASATFVPNTISGIVVSDYKNKVTLHSGTTAVDATVRFGWLYAMVGGVAENTVVGDFGRFLVSGGGTANGAAIGGYGAMAVHEAGIANSVSVASGGVLNVSGGTASDVTVSNVGKLIVLSGSAVNVTSMAGAIISSGYGAYITYAE